MAFNWLSLMSCTKKEEDVPLTLESVSESDEEDELIKLQQITIKLKNPLIKKLR
jgi:hypothetical protein